jgi:DNA-binding winged helix-turn-helix (wHTH) protein
VTVLICANFAECAAVTYRFEDFTLDTASRRLTCGDRVIALVPKAFDLLVLLLEERPRLLSKEELHRRLWPGTFVSDASLSGLVALIREALGDNAREPRFIRTAHRVGYGFVSAVDAKPSVPSSLARPSTGSWLTMPNRQFALAEGENIVGRDPAADVSLQFPGVSRRHARVVVSEGVATIYDLGSKNGTWVRGQRIAAPCVLYDGDQLRIGSMLLTFRATTTGMSTATEAINRT